MVDGIEIRGLVKRYPRSRSLRELLRGPGTRQTVTALGGIDLTIPRGGIYALLGPNGAGKTTLLKILGGLLLPNEGSVCIDGQDLTHSPVTIRERVGLIVCDERSFYWRLSVRENIRFFATLNGYSGRERAERVDRCLADAGILDQADTLFMRLSTGMRQRLAVARGLLLEPTILLMDEATRSLDPESRTRIHELVTGLVEQAPHRIIVYSTHDLAEAEQIADHVIVIRKGAIVIEQPLRGLASAAGPAKGCGYRVVTDPPLTTEDVESVNGATLLHVEDRGASVHLTSPRVVDALVDHLRSRGRHILEITPERSSLTDLYMASTSEEP